MVMFLIVSTAEFPFFFDKVLIKELYVICHYIQPRNNMSLFKTTKYMRRIAEYVLGIDVLAQLNR